MILEKINQLLQQVDLLKAKNAEEVEQLRLKFLSKNGELNELMKDFRAVPAEQKKEVGMKINELKQRITDRINFLREECTTQESSEEVIDLTRTPYPIPCRATSAHIQHICRPIRRHVEWPCYTSAPGRRKSRVQ